MANNYEKKDVASFKAALESGKYESLTGARRAIGKFQEWTDADRDKARALADKHFGAEGGSAPAKKAPKAKAAPAANGEQKRRGRPPGSKNKPKEGASAAPAKAPKAPKAAAPAKKKVARVAAKTPVAEAPKKRGRKPGTTVAKKTPVRSPRSGSVNGTVAEMNSVIGTLSQAINAIKDSSTIVGDSYKSEFDAALNKSVKALGRAAQVLDKEVIEPHIGADASDIEETPAERGANSTVAAPAN